MNTNKALIHLKESDSILRKVIESVGPFEMNLESNYFYALTKAIIFQQLNGKAASTIFKRLEEYLNFSITPRQCLTLSPETYRSLGISKQKCSYILDLSHHFTSDPLSFENLDQFSDEEIIKKLTQVKGIGKWTAQMFLMFTLCRPDVFPADDLGIKKAISLLYDFTDYPNKSEMESVATKWSPYRTIASWYLWRSLD